MRARLLYVECSQLLVSLSQLLASLSQLLTSLSLLLVSLSIIPSSFGSCSSLWVILGGYNVGFFVCWVLIEVLVFFLWLLGDEYYVLVVAPGYNACLVLRASGYLLDFCGTIPISFGSYSLLKLGIGIFPVGC